MIFVNLIFVVLELGGGEFCNVLRKLMFDYGIRIGDLFLMKVSFFLFMIVILYFYICILLLLEFCRNVLVNSINSR